MPASSARTLVVGGSLLGTPVAVDTEGKPTVPGRLSPVPDNTESNVDSTTAMYVTDSTDLVGVSLGVEARASGSARLRITFDACIHLCAYDLIPKCEGTRQRVINPCSLA